MNMKDIVARGVAAHAEIDAALADARLAAMADPADESACLIALQRARKASRALEGVHEDGVAAGMVPRALAAKMIIHRARGVTGLINAAAKLANLLPEVAADDVVDAIAAAGLASAELHAEDTRIAQANNVDTGALQTVAGIVMPMSGGR